MLSCVGTGRAGEILAWLVSIVSGRCDGRIAYVAPPLQGRPRKAKNLNAPTHSGRVDLVASEATGDDGITRKNRAEIVGMDSKASFYVGNAALDQVRGTGWFVGQFVPPELGLRHQTDVELKWGVHKNGEKRSHPSANGNSTTISVLIKGTLHVTFQRNKTSQGVTLQQAGDYVVFGPEIVHSWEAVGDTIVLTVRFPSVEINRQQNLHELEPRT